ncbi:protein of unknown function [Moritella yayanosii]|uniref:Uncharacterized protein n=1 Tax=Moritella yayanosii TaxID=69539 RepID=A0A330LXH4_9GAMM|nr:protein of unknown function [Moritella yayanosii]
MAVSELNRHLIATTKQVKRKSLIIMTIKHKLITGKILPIL